MRVTLFATVFIPIFLASQISYADDPIEKKVKRLNQLSLRNPLIHLNSESFRTLVDQTPKNYSVIVLLTAGSSERGCIPCREAANEYQIVASSWRFSQQYDSRLFFTVADYDVVPEVFSLLNMNTAPAFVHVPPRGDIKSADRFDIQSRGFMAESLSQWIEAQTKIKIRIYRPPSYTGAVLLLIFMGLGGAALWFGRINIDAFYNRSFWCMTTMIVIFCGISGQVYNQIRGPPLLHATRNGGIQAVVYPGSNFQFVAETFIVSLLYVGTTAGVLIVHRVNETTDPGKRKAYMLGGIALLFVAFSALLAVFRKKYQGYPYSLFL